MKLAKHIIPALFLAPLILSCSKKPVEIPVPAEPQPSPTGLYFERLTESILQMHWRDASESESGYSVWILPDGASTPEKIGETAQNETSFAIASGLESGRAYSIGIRTDSSDEELCSDIEYIPVKMIPFASIPAGAVSQSRAMSSCLAVTYSFRNYSDLSDIETGLCWSTEGVATVDDSRLCGPKLPSSGRVLQIIPNANLEAGKTYSVRAYMTSSSGTYYLDAGEMSVGDAIEPVELEWKAVSVSGLPEGISVWESVNATVSGRSLRAWYAVADLSSGEFEFRANVPSSLATIDDQAASFWGDCYIMVNGGYFASGQHTGIAIEDFRVTGSINNQRGTIDAADSENMEIYPTTRGIFGIDSYGHPSVYWANGSGYAVNYFASPVPSVKGEEKYPSRAEDWASAQLVHWLPRAAISAAPVLLKDGKCPFDFTHTDRGDKYYYTNFEFVADDIFGEDVLCDRTAVGATEDGKIVFFICDGRMDDSRGLNLLELAGVMKGIGCVDALNLDGGGSTGMMVAGTHFGDTTVGGNRKVMSTVGLFRRR